MISASDLGTLAKCFLLRHRWPMYCGGTRVSLKLLGGWMCIVCCHNTSQLSSQGAASRTESHRPDGLPSSLQMSRRRGKSVLDISYVSPCVTGNTAAEEVAACNNTGNALYVSRNIGARSFYRCCSGEAINVTYSKPSYYAINSFREIIA